MVPETLQRKLIGILSADVKGRSRLMGEDETETVRTLTAYRELMSNLILKHRGRIVDSPGDNLLAEFDSVVDAVQCAVEILKRGLIRNPDFIGNHLLLAAIYAEAGRMEDARVEVEEILRISPNFSLEVLKEMAPVKDQAELDRFAEALRKAGLS